MSDDIISRLRELAKPGTSLEDVGGVSVFTEAASEIDRLRTAIRRLADQDATLSVQGGSVIVEMDATPEMLERFAQRGGPLVSFELPQPTLTDAEREAIGRAIDSLEGVEDLLPTAAVNDPADTLRGLLARCALGHQDGR